MKIAYFDCFSGIAGDMALAALLDCGVPLETLREGLKSLPVEGWAIEATPVLPSGIHALSARITLNGVSDEEELAVAQVDHQNHHHHHDIQDAHHDVMGNLGHHHDHGHSHHNSDHSHDHEHHHHHHGRSMAEIRDIIYASALSGRVKRDSLKIFEKIAIAEAKIHHSTPEEIHFHEIGGVDSLIDICGVAWCLEYLEIEEIYCSALPHSTGWVDCAHGRMPIPAPATLEILVGAPWTPTDLRGELVTPTGAGIVGALAQGFGPPPAFSMDKIGVGAGKKHLADRPNILRVVVGEKIEAQKPLDGLEWRDLAVIESNIDDMNPELFDGVFDRLFAAGALDVWLQPIQMKKNRPAQLLNALCDDEQKNGVIEAILRETTTLGVRISPVSRAALPREIREVLTPHGTLRVKTAKWHDWERTLPEYDDVKRLAVAANVPAREVYEAAIIAAKKA